MRKIIIFILMMFTLVSFSYAADNATQLNNHILTYYELGEAGSPYDDSAPSDVDFTCAGTCPTQAVGIIGNGQSADGTKYASSEANIIYNNLGYYTVCVWIKPNELPTTQYYVGQYDTNMWQYFYNSLTTLILQNYQAGTDRFSLTSTGHRLHKDKWNFVCASRITLNTGNTWINGNESHVYTQTSSTVLNGGNDIIHLLDATTGSGYGFNGTIDELMFFDIPLNDSQIQWLYNNGTPTSNQQYPFSEGAAVNMTSTLNYPINETHYHLVGANASKVYNGSIMITTSVNANCTINNTLWTNVLTDGISHQFLNNTALPDNNYSINYNCTSGVLDTRNEFWFIVDTLDPNIDLFQPLDKSKHSSNFILNLSYSDLYLYRTNTTIIRIEDEVTVYNNFSGDLLGVEYYNITDFINVSNISYPIGKYRLVKEATDTHTKKDFKEDPSLTNKITKDKNNYKTELDLKKGYFAITHPLDMDIKTIKENDRILFKHTKIKKEKTSIYIEADKLVYLPSSRYPCHFIINDNYWYDCVGFTEPKIHKEKNNYYRIDFTMDKTEVITESLGGLNYVNLNSTFNIQNSSTGLIIEGTVYTPPLAKDMYYNITSNFTVTTLVLNTTCIIITGSLLYDGEYCYDVNSIMLDDVIAFVDMTPVDCLANVTNFVGFTIPTFSQFYNKTDFIIQTGSKDCEHGQTCTLDTLLSSNIKFNDTLSCSMNITGDFFTFTSNRSNSINTSSIGKCTGVNIYPLVNITYFDEVDNTNINATNSFSVLFSDGLGTINLAGNFSLDYNHQFCTSVDPSNATVNLNMWGNFTLTKTGYGTRILNFIETNPFLVSNKPVTNISMSLIKLNESGVIQYTWRTTSFQFINGLMIIKHCNDDGTKTLLSSIPVANGFASANLQLFTIPYSYEIIIDGITYTDSSFSVCHVENVQERSYFVDVDLIDILPAISLFLVDCVMTEPSNTTARITWTANQQDTGNIYGCMVGTQFTAFGEEEIFRNCSNSSVGDFTRTVPNNGNEITVTGEIWQNGNKGYCQQTLSFYKSNSINNILKLSGLLAALLIVMISTYLLINESGTAATIGTGLGYVVSFFFGVLLISWQIVMMVLFLLIAIALIARYTKKSQIG